VTVVATGLGEPRRTTAPREKAFHEVPMQVVANGTDGRTEPVFSDEELGRRATAQESPVMGRGNDDLFTRQKDIDYLDIPSFLRNQAD
jgi:hypothetical protein